MNIRASLSRKLLLLSAFLGLVLAASGARAAPYFVLDGRYHELAQLRLAEDEQGTITALDLFFYLDMTRNALAISDIDLWLAPEDEREEDIWSDIADATYEYLAIRSLARRTGPVAAPDFVKEALLFSAAEAAWIETTIRQEIVVEPADIDRFYIANPDRYIGKARAQVRYIYLPVPEDADAAAQREAENKLGALRDSIVRGETTFEQAAMQASAAPSARAGGLIPEFERGTHFPELEVQAFRLARPGQLSPVFVGNEGVYLLQLVTKTEETKKPLKEVEAEIRKRLEQTHVGPYYRLHYGRLKAKDFHQNFLAIWQYADLGAPIAIAQGRKLTRDETIRINPSVVNANYEVQWNVLASEVEGWLEGVTIYSDLRKRGLDRHPLIERAEPIADQVIAGRAGLIRAVDPARVATPEAARRTLAQGAGAPEGNQGGLPQSRVVKISLAPDAAAAQAGREEILRESIRDLSRSLQRGLIPTTPAPVAFIHEWSKVAGKPDEEVEAKLDEARRAVRASGFSGVTVTIEFMGWVERLPGLSPHPALARLEPGRVARATSITGGVEHFVALETRFSTDSPWLEVPLALESAAFDTLRLAALRFEVNQAEETGRLLFKVPEKKEGQGEEDSESAGDTAAEE